jgi:hypothetical protein
LRTPAHPQPPQIPLEVELERVPVSLSTSVGICHIYGISTVVRFNREPLGIGSSLNYYYLSRGIRYGLIRPLLPVILGVHRQASRWDNSSFGQLKIRRDVQDQAPSYCGYTSKTMILPDRGLDPSIIAHRLSPSCVSNSVPDIFAKCISFCGELFLQLRPSTIWMLLLTILSSPSTL